MSTAPHLGYQAILQSWPFALPCMGFTNLPLARPTRVVVAADPPALPERDDVLAALRQDLLSLGAASDACGGPGWLGCWTTNDPAARNVLVVMADASGPSVALQAAVDDWLAQPGFEVLGVLAWGVDADVALPPSMRRVNALQWESDPREIVPQIVDAVLLDAEDRRIFISYARSDGSATADRIFDVLSAARFDVFLDRFKLPPGQDFVERIEDEIVDKSMVVIVETDAAARSEWVRHEVAVALKRGLGVAAANLGGHPETPGIVESLRFRGGDDAALADFLLREHRVQLAMRRESLRESVWQALVDAGVSPPDITATALGYSVQIGAARRLVGVSVRPADLHRFRVVREMADPDDAFLVHPPPTLHRRRRDLEWLSERADVTEVDEGRITEAAAAVVAP